MTHKAQHSVGTRTHLTGVRIHDLVAKTARVNLKDTIRVLLALDTIASFLDESADILLENPFIATKPKEQEIDKCTEAHSELEDYLVQSGEGDWLGKIKAVEWVE